MRKNVSPQQKLSFTNFFSIDFNCDNERYKYAFCLRLSFAFSNSSSFIIFFFFLLSFNIGMGTIAIHLKICQSGAGIGTISLNRTAELVSKCVSYFFPEQRFRKQNMLGFAQTFLRFQFLKFCFSWN